MLERLPAHRRGTFEEELRKLEVRKSRLNATQIAQKSLKTCSEELSRGGFLGFGYGFGAALSQDGHSIPASPEMRVPAPLSPGCALRTSPLKQRLHAVAAPWRPLLSHYIYLHMLLCYIVVSLRPIAY